MSNGKIGILYFGIVFTIAILLFSCEDSIVDPKGVPGPAEERILFTKGDGPISQICSIKPDGTDIDTIASHNSAGEFLGEGYAEAHWSPDKSKIVITGGPRESLEYEPLWLMDNQGNLIRRITREGYSPNWSSDGNEILFARLASRLTFIVNYYIININTLSERLALKGEGYEWANADWSSDEKYILTQEQYTWYNEDGKRETTDQEVVLLELSSGKKLQLTDTEVMDAGPHWSPDDSRIVYISGTYGTGYQIMLMNNDGSGKTTLVDSVAGYNTVHWSPAGDKVAFSMTKKLEGWVNYAKGSDIFVYDMISGEVDKLTNFAADSIKVYVQDWK